MGFRCHVRTVKGTEVGLHNGAIFFFDKKTPDQIHALLAKAHSRKASKKISVEMTLAQALALGIVRCICGHRPNNHFDFRKKSCAHCDCKAYEQRIVLPR